MEIVLKLLKILVIFVIAWFISFFSTCIVVAQETNQPNWTDNSSNTSQASNDDEWWTIIPVKSWWVEADFQAWKVWDQYNEKLKKIEEKPWYLWDSFTTGIFGWDSIFYFLKYLVNFLSQVWLVIWAVMIIYSGYKYTTWVFAWKSTTGNEPLKMAIYGVVIVIFSYAIMNLMINMFLK